MSSFNRRWFLIGILPLTACGFEPVYGTNKSANNILGKIDVEVFNGQNAFVLRDRLINRLGSPVGNSTYLLKCKSRITSKSLTISKKNYVSRYILQGQTTFKLIDITTKKILYKNTVVSNTAYSSTEGTYQTSVAKRDANIRLSSDMADKIATLLLISVEDWVR